ncbi:MAG TPA: G1 family glutamic endopeptidase [Thermoplasmata archaeon]|nr:G1 family glutamic endopeptidase [Thermoplasmata archaeon]
MRGTLRTMMVLTCLAAVLVPAAGAVAPLAHIPAVGFSHNLRFSTTSSGNWAGWAVTGAKGSVTDVKGSWTVPTVTGCSASSHTYSSFWVGIDGYSSPSVEQTGTDSDCNGAAAQYYAWYEFYPKPSHVITALKISPGDVVSAEVSFAAGKFTTKISDTTTGHSFTTSASVKAQRTSAEWIAEAPSSISGILPLADFGTVSFGLDNTGISSTDTATVSSVTSGIGNFTSAVSINMVGIHNSSLVKAATSALSTDQTSFSVTWKAAGP